MLEVLIEEGDATLVEIKRKLIQSIVSAVSEI